MDSQFIAAALEAACDSGVSRRVETYAIGLAISHEINQPLAEFRVVGDSNSYYSRAYRFRLNHPARFQRGKANHLPSGPDDHVWVLIEGGRSLTARVFVNLAGSFDDLATSDYPNYRELPNVAWLDIPAEIERAIADLIACKQEIAA